jgi:hypothetical protein
MTAAFPGNPVFLLTEIKINLTMKKNRSLRLAVAKLRTACYSAVLFLSVFGSSGCSQRECDKPGPAENCNTFATVEEDECWNTFLGNKLLRLDNGELLLPQNSIVTLPSVQNGERVKLAYIAAASDPQYSNTCNYIQAPEKTTPVTITCMEQFFKCGTITNGCDTYVTAENVACGSGVWQNTWLRLDDGTWFQPWECNVPGIKPEAGKRYKIAYQKRSRDNRYDGQVTCLAMPPASDAITINCMEEVNPGNTSGN